MTRIRGRLAAGIVLLIVLSGAFFAVQSSTNSSLITARNLEQSMINMHDTAQDLERVENNSQAVVQSVMESNLSKKCLTSEYLGSDAQDVSFFEDRAPVGIGKHQAIVKVSGEKIEVPEDMPKDLEVRPSIFTQDRGWFQTGEEAGTGYVVYYQKYSSSLYFMEWETFDESPLSDERAAREEAIRAIEASSGIHILRYFLTDEDGERNYQPVYIPEEFAGIGTEDDIGITQQMLFEADKMNEERSQDTEQSLEDTIPYSEFLDVGGTSYLSYFVTMDGGETVTVFMFPFDSGTSRSVQEAGILLIVFVIIAGAFLAWVLSVFVVVIEHNLNDEQKRTFSPKLIRVRAAVFFMAGLILIGAASVYVQCIFANFNMTVVAERSLATVTGRLEMDRKRADDYEKMRMASYESCAEILASVLSGNTVPNAYDLQKYCTDIHADYIIIFDENGREVETNSVYSNLTLSGSGEDMKTFRRLLKGVPVISKKDVHDEVTGLTRDVFGASMIRIDDETDERLIWALIIVVDPDEVRAPSIQTVDEIMGSVAMNDTLCFSVDSETKEIKAASDAALAGRNAQEMGLPDEALRDSYMGFFRFNNQRVYGKSSEKDGVIYYYAVEQGRMYRDIPDVIESAVVSYLILMAVFVIVMLLGYGKTYDRYSSLGNVLAENDNKVMTSSGRWKRSVDPSKRWVFSSSGYGSRTPFHNAFVAVELIYLAAVAAIVAGILSGWLRADNSAIAFILWGNWTRGWNLFALTNILFLFVEVSIGVIIIKFLIRSATMHIGTKGETIGRLMLSFVSYVSVIIFIYFALSYVGIDTRTLAASLGLITFALSLGAQDLVKDILAGLAIVFDGAYQVGDIIEVNGFRGKVMEVGVRSIKIEGRGGNIMILGNQDVRNIINKTRKNSWYAMEVEIADDQNIREVEQMLADHLPGIGEEYPQIISGPFYKGITQIGHGTVTLSIIAECDEEDYFKVQRQLNRAVISMFEAHGIQIK